jgi:hypothetical protein
MKIDVEAIAPHEFRVVVEDDGGKSEYLVRVSLQDLAHYGAGATGKQLVEESFRFLLERERKEEILRALELPVIDRLYPEFHDEITRRLSEPRPLSDSIGAPSSPA